MTMLEFLNFDPLQALKFTKILLGGAVVTIQITIASLIVSIILGLIVAVINTSRIRIGRFLASVYIEIFRDVPALTILFISYFGLAHIGINIEAIPAAILGLGLIGGAVLAEVFRSGLEALHAGQREAALAVGMTLFPLTAPTTLPLRVILTDVPVWQIASSIGLLVGSAIFGSDK